MLTDLRGLTTIPKTVATPLVVILHSLRQTDGAEELLDALVPRAEQTAEEYLQETARIYGRLRFLFYAAVGRRQPNDLRSLPSYVNSVKRRFNLVSGNEARQVLAHVEGYVNWAAVMDAALGTTVIQTNEDNRPIHEAFSPRSSNHVTHSSFQFQPEA